MIVASKSALNVCRLFHQKSNNICLSYDIQPPEQIGFTGCLLPNLTKLMLTKKE
jgi:hypothetical protein